MVVLAADDPRLAYRGRHPLVHLQHLEETMSLSKCEQCSHQFEFDEINETQVCPNCGFETRAFPLPRLQPTAPARGVAHQNMRPKAPLASRVIPVIIIVAFVLGIGFGGDTVREAFILCVALIFGALIYFAPAIIAYKRYHRNAVAITVLTVFAGWTFLGWVGALVWAFTEPNR